MTYKILVPDVNYVCNLTVRPWNPFGEANPVFLVDSKTYMSKVQEALGDACTVGDFEDAYVTPKFDYYAEDVEDGFEGTPDETISPTPEVNNNYVGENIILPRGNDMDQGRVRKRA